MLSRIRKISLLAAVLALVIAFPGAASEERNHAISRLDEDGYLYYMDYTMDYYGPEVLEALRKGGFIDLGCSSFFTHDEEGNPITCRNYDYPHRVSQEDKTLTGLNVVIHCKPEGKYESVAMADAVWCDEKNPLLQKGGPDLPGFDIHLLDVLPYECMDGINEKGLCVSILRESGYGHGYHRFVTIASQLDRYQDTGSEDRYTRMPKSAALDILQCATQNPYTNASGISMTQYSVIYNNAQKTLEVWPFQNYQESWVFDTAGNRQ